MLDPRMSSFSSLLSLAVAVALGGCSDDPPGESAGSESGEDTAAEASTAAGDTTGGGVNTGSADGSSSGTVEETGTDPTTGGPGPGVACLDDQFVNGPSPGPDYSEFDVELGSHCQGTNQQDITDIERVVFLGDSVTVGTRPTSANDIYRALVADELAALYGLQAPEFLWKQPNVFDGTATVQESGDFASCAVWGARNDDLETQLADCFGPDDFDQRTLVVMTMGGNDVASLARDAIDGVPLATLLEEVEAMVALHEQAIQWLVGEDRFPAGVFVVNANVYEFTDDTLDLLSCPAASTAGFDSNPKNPDVLISSLTLINEEYMRIAEEAGTDVVFMFEGFCGHGFHADDPASPCYRGAGSENWFDFTCIHPTPTGHAALADMFINVISE